MAVFAAVGLSASCLTVIFWHPLLSRGLPVRPVPAMGLMLRWLAAWRRNKKLYIGLPLTLALFSLAGIATLRVDDDISQLQALPQHLLAEEKAITALTGQSVDQKWFVVYGATPQQTLERLEAFTPALPGETSGDAQRLSHACRSIRWPVNARIWRCSTRQPRRSPPRCKTPGSKRSIPICRHAGHGR
jgi:predicted exporter